MKVILLRDIRGFGRKNEVKNASDGYARNFLLPRGLAKPVAEDEIKVLKEKAAGEAVKIEEEKKRLVTVAGHLKTQRFVFEVKAGGKGKIFGAVSDKDIQSKLRDEGYSVQAAFIERSLKTLGEHAVKLDLGLGITAETTIVLDEAAKKAA